MLSCLLFVYLFYRIHFGNIEVAIFPCKNFQKTKGYTKGIIIIIKVLQQCSVLNKCIVDYNN